MVLNTCTRCTRVSCKMARGISRNGFVPYIFTVKNYVHEVRKFEIEMERKAVFTRMG